MKSVTVCGLGIGAALLASSIAHADGVEATGPADKEVGLFVGGFVSNFFHQLYDTNLYHDQQVPQLDTVSPQFGGRFSYFMGKYLGLEAEGSVAIANVSGHSGATIFGLQGQVVLQRPGTFTPFFDAGFGLWHVESDVDSLGRTTIWPLHVGVGVRWYFLDNLAIRLDGRIYRGPSSKDPYTLDATYGDFSIGLSYVPGRKEPEHRVVVRERETVDVDKDSDSDGILDSKDKCKDKPETVNGYQDEDGCPDEVPDSDHDGIDDLHDKCPTEPEDKDNFQDDDGCPDPDNDNDGITDAMDKCPNEAGPVENHGCPDVDTDGDGVVDRLDNCPQEKGTVANHGCKDKQRVVITQNQLKILDQVQFQTGTAKLGPRAKPLLDNIYRVLAAHPEIKKIKVEGHTDNVGKPDKNQKLSEDRAASVVAYLVKKGVAADRLEAIGHGDTAPIADNKTAKGREINRRVEFNIVDTPAN